METETCRCSCGTTEFAVTAEPLFRFNCHCTICQRFNNAPFADVLVYRAADVTAPPETAVRFNTYKAPPNVQRGKCSQCGEPAIEQFRMPLMPKLTIIPRNMFAGDSTLPEPAFHAFYDKHVAETSGSAPRYNGFLRSQLAFMVHLFRALRQRKR